MKRSNTNTSRTTQKKTKSPQPTKRKKPQQEKGQRPVVPLSQGKKTVEGKNEGAFVKKSSILQQKRKRDAEETKATTPNEKDQQGERLANIADEWPPNLPMSTHSGNEVEISSDEGSGDEGEDFFGDNKNNSTISFDDDDIQEEEEEEEEDDDEDDDGDEEEEEEDNDDDEKNQDSFSKNVGYDEKEVDKSFYQETKTIGAENSDDDDDDDDGVVVLETYDDSEKIKPTEKISKLFSGGNGVIDSEEDDKMSKIMKGKSMFDDVDNIDDSSEDEADTNTVGNIPLEWYEEYDHIGYDRDGEKIIRKKKKDALDHLVARHDDPNYLRTVYDEYNDRDYVLSDKDLAIISNIQKGRFPPGYNPYKPYVDYVKVDSRFPLVGNMEPKRKFLPDKDEQKIIDEIKKRILAGKRPWPGQKRELKRKEDVYLLWGEDDKVIGDENIQRLDDILIPPKVTLPGHRDSYNPPPEYLRKNDVRYSSLREVPGYGNYIKEAFERCLDLYLAPRQQVIRKTVRNPDILLPELPKPNELRPFPEIQSLIYRGHSDLIRCVSVNPTGKWLISGSHDNSVRLWEVDTGRCVRVWNFENDIKSIEWNPNPMLNIFAIAVENYVYLVKPPETGNEESNKTTENLFPTKAFEDESEIADDLIRVEVDEDVDENDTQGEQNIEASSKTGRKKLLLTWKFYRSEDDKTKRKQGILCCLTHLKVVTQVVWHCKGDYFCTLSPDAYNDGIVIHQLSKRLSQKPFKKRMKQKSDKVVQVMFHPKKPLFFVVQSRSIKVFNLMKQKLHKRLQGQKSKYTSTVDIHPSGEHIIIGGYDKRVEWFDLQVSTSPYKSLRFHEKAVRSVCFHKRYPLFATCSDDCTIRVFHATVYEDWLKDPLIAPVKILKAHAVSEFIGITKVVFHPTQPWLFSCGADHTIRLFTS